ncbi:sensor histidine kinase [Vagococcus elongatus]|uniref:Sensor histidine kinase n=1 Tax=Vagococcus elongatus TaxID=180344 RepID=A0A430B200_9ENTE|nr:sensor histidine kinase [Vagococcus elongatus]RSU14367.1 two-component sensor histidine kinase [Vagococcus elongatus]
MMSKQNRPLIFLYTFIFSFIVLVLTLYTYFYSQGKREWLKELFRTKITYIPLIVYLILIALVVSTMVYIVVYFFHRSQYGRLEEKISLLARNHYDSPLFMKTVRNGEGDPYVSNIDEGIEKIREQMLSMSKDLQVLSSRPQMVDGESKEQILQEERHRLARELHDSVSQQLFAASMMMSALMEDAKKNGQSEIIQKQMNMIGDIINASQSEMRALLLHLRPISLEGKSLKKGIEQLLVELQSKIKIALHWEVEDVSLQSGMEDHLFRVVQELLSNTLRHAKAKSLEVFLKKTDKVVLLRMIDDGVGFDTSNKKVGSYGLNNINERITGMGGTCKIISFVGKGTSVEIRVPVIEEDEEE